MPTNDDYDDEVEYDLVPIDCGWPTPQSRSPWPAVAMTLTYIVTTLATLWLVL